MILLDELLMGRDKEYPPSEQLLKNACDLLARVNYLLGWLKQNRQLSSGYRPGIYNKNYAKKSPHLTLEGLDLVDIDRSLGKILLDNIPMLKELGLYLEHPNYTKGWAHLDTKKRQNTVFIP